MSPYERGVQLRGKANRSLIYLIQSIYKRNCSQAKKIYGKILFTKCVQYLIFFDQYALKDLQRFGFYLKEDVATILREDDSN